jgi:hypothetical protein
MGSAVQMFRRPLSKPFSLVQASLIAASLDLQGFDSADHRIA